MIKIKARKVCVSSAERRRFIIDSGACIDLIALKDVSTKEMKTKYKTDRPITLRTANGKLECDSVVKLDVDGH